MATHIQASGVFSLACPVGGERLPLSGYSVDVRCSCGGTAIPYCHVHGAHLHICNQPPTRTGTPMAVCVLAVILLATSMASGVALVLWLTSNLSTLHL